MSADRLGQIQRVFDEAVERPPEQRAAFLAEACRDDAGLRAEVESLLAHDEHAPPNFLQPPPAPVPLWPDTRTADGPDPLIGTKIGRYQVQRVIAAGGMGTVYEAVQEQPQRTVALKVMDWQTGGASALRRFRQEAEVLGRLQHPHIAQVYEAGVADTSMGEVPFFAMEYVPDARTLTQHAHERKLDIRARLELFALVCDAVQHGHHHAVIHRDLKPANILVNGAGQPKIIDFGVARVLDRDLALTTQQTCAGQLIGTVQYMSPEQCGGDPHAIDTRSDVYSLGVVLYELLTGALPYEATGVTLLQATQAIREAPPRRPSALNRRLRGDVETIVLKALEKEPARRYGSAAELGRDIRHYLDREPIEAHAPTAWTRAVRWVGRHPLAATVVLCLGMAGMVVAATYVAVWYLNSRPYELESVPRTNERPGLYRTAELRLVSRTGRELKRWRTADGREGVGGIIFERPRQLGGGRIVALAVSGPLEDGLPVGLHLFDVGRSVDEPLWSRNVTTEEVLPELLAQRGFDGGRFACDTVGAYDVFPENGVEAVPEIVATFSVRNHSQNCLRVYDLSRTLLYEVWHDGSMSNQTWLASRQLLVFAGENHEGRYDRQGRLTTEDVQPAVVFALRPQRHIFRDRWLSSRSDGPEPHPAWYLGVGSTEADLPIMAARLDAASLPWDPETHVAFSVSSGNREHGTVNWVLDADGCVADGPDPIDEYEWRRTKQQKDPSRPPVLPNPYSLYLAPCTGPPVRPIPGERPCSDRPSPAPDSRPSP